MHTKENLIIDKIIKYNTKLPRYTSYPTSPHFHENIDENEVRKWYNNISHNNKLSLYIHIPFCRDICWYCGCHTKATKQDKPILEYLNYLEREIKQSAKRLNCNPKVINLHLGGGSPTILNVHSFSKLMESIKEFYSLSPSTSIAIEVDPRYINESKIAAYAKHGVNRVSIGVQDFNKKTQKAINRIQPFHRVYEAVMLFKSYGIDAINFDLIYGLPYQTLESFKKTIEYTIMLSPQRIALFGYAHVPQLKKHMHLIDKNSLPSPKERVAIFSMASKQLSKAGYTAIGIDHFVRSDDPMLSSLQNQELHRNFQGYTTDQSDTLLGFGVSAISKFKEGYLQNTTDITKYKKCISNFSTPYQQGFQLDNEDRCVQFIIERLMCDLKINLKDVKNRFPNINNNLFDQTSELKILHDDGLIKLSKESISIQKNAKQIVRKVCAYFDRYHQEKSEKHSQMA